MAAAMVTTNYEIEMVVFIGVLCVSASAAPQYEFPRTNHGMKNWYTLLKSSIQDRRQ
jgi:hypothetical protein